jgi:hypothetical protein
VRGEHDQRALRDLLGPVDEDRAALLEGLDDVPVVHDLLAHVDGRAVLFQRLLDGLDGAVDARAVAARLGQQDALVPGDVGPRSVGHGSRVRTARGPVGGPGCRRHGKRG